MISPRMARAGLGAFALGLALCLPPHAQARGCSGPITVSTGQWEPYAYFDAGGRFVGIDIDMTRAIFKEAGCVLVELPSRPTVRNLLLFESGEIDLMMGASLTPERQRFARFSVAYRDETVGLFSLAENAGRYRAMRSFDALLASPATLLAPKAGWYGAQYARHMQEMREAKRLSQFMDFAQGMRMLAAGRADFMMGDASAVENAAVHLGVRVQPLPFWVLQAPVHLMFSRRTVTPADVARLDAAIGRLQKRGEFERIRRTYAGG